MKKIYVIQSVYYYWNMESGYTSSSSSVEFVFSSKKRALEQLDAIAMANAEGIYWSGCEFEHEEDVETFGGDSVRTDLYTHVDEDLNSKVSYYFHIREMVLNNGYNL